MRMGRKPLRQQEAKEVPQGVLGEDGDTLGVGRILEKYINHQFVIHILTVVRTPYLLQVVDVKQPSGMMWNVQLTETMDVIDK